MDPANKQCGDLSSIRAFIGLDAGRNNSGNHVFMVGEESGSNNTGSSVNNLGYFAGRENTGSYVNNMGPESGQMNSGINVNNFGPSSGTSNTGNNVNNFGDRAGNSNTGDGVNNFGGYAGYMNSGGKVNNLGDYAGTNNNGWYTNNIGLHSGENNLGSGVNNIGTATGKFNTGNYVNNIGEFAGQNNTGEYSSHNGFEAGITNNFDYCYTNGRASACNQSNQFMVGSATYPMNIFTYGDVRSSSLFDSTIRVVRSCTAGSGISCSVTDGVLSVSATGGGTVTSVTGTANQISSTGGTTPVLSIPADFRAPGSIAAGVTPLGTTAGDVNGLRWLSPSATDFSAYAGRTTAPNFVVTSQGATSNYAKVGSGNGNIISYGGDGSSADLHVVLGSKGSYPTSLFPGGVEALRAQYVALAANYVSVYPAVTSPIRIVAEGTGPNVGINLEGKGSGNIDHYAGGGLVLRVSGFVSVPVNNVIILASNSGQPLLVGSQGTDTDISIYLQSKAAGAAGLRAGSTNLFDCTTARCTTLASTPLQDNGVRVVRSCTAGSGISCSVTDGVLSVTNTAPGTVSGSAPSFVAFGAGACIASGTPAFSVYRGTWPSFVIRVDAGLTGCTSGEPIVTFSVGTTCTGGRPYCSIAKYSRFSGEPATVTPNVEWPAVNPESRIMLRADMASTGLSSNSINHWMFVCQCGV